MFLIFLLLCSLVCGAPISMQASVTLQANGTTPATTFTGNNVFAHTIGGDDTKLQWYLGRNDASVVSGSDATLSSYAVSVAIEGYDKVFPYASETVTLNGILDQPNPVFGQKIQLMGTLSATPFMVLHSELQNIYWNASRMGLAVQQVASVENIKDATGTTTGAIVSVAGMQVKASTSQVSVGGNYIAAVVAPNGTTNFGAAGSGVALVGSGSSILQQLPAVTETETIQSVPLDGKQSYVKNGASAVINNNQPDISFDPILQRIYIAFSASGSSGARGIVMGYLNPTIINPTLTENKLILTDFVPAAAYTGAGMAYVGGVANTGETVTLSKFRSLYTSTGLTYGIVVGSSNAGAYPLATTVSAIPLVNKSVDPVNTNWPVDPTHGAMASKTVKPGINLKIYFSQTNTPQTYLGRGFQAPATTLDDVPAQEDPAVWVGGADAPGYINDIQVFKDTVFIATQATGSNPTGIFASQAMFDQYGAIKAWTAWQRVSYPSQPGVQVWGLAFQQSLGKMFSMVGTAYNRVDTITTSTWVDHNNDGLLGGTAADASVGFITELNKQFIASQGGIQGLFDFPVNTDGFIQSGSNRLSVMVATGYQKIALVQTSADTAGSVLTPTIGDFGSHIQSSTNGSITAPAAGTLMLSVSGGALTTLGAITSAAIINDGAGKGYLVVGGVGGIAVLKPGWTTGFGQGLTKNFGNLPASTFTILGSYKNVRKLLNDGTNLYVLTNTTLDRIPASQLSGTTITPTTVAAPASVGTNQYVSFSDVVISAKMALLATSQGLFRVGSGQNIATVASSAAASWTLVPLGESLTAVIRLTPFSSTGLPQDFSRSVAGLTGTPGGQVYALSGSVSQGLASLYRISVADTSTTAITDATVQVVLDYCVEAKTSAFAAYGGYRNYFRTDGALITDSRSSYLGDKPVFEALPGFIRTGSWLMANKETQIPLSFSTGSTVGGLIRNSGLGSLILPVSTGIQVLE